MNTRPDSKPLSLSDSSSAMREPIELLADEFLERKRRGEHPTIEQYEAQHPQLAQEIRDLFPALLLMDNLGDGSLGATPSAAGRSATRDFPRSNEPAPERLGDYTILREIGRGGMGVVYEAEQGSLGRRVALKVLPAHALANPTQLRRFEREARAAGRLHHTNIVPVFGVGVEGSSHYYVMQYIQGQPLNEVLSELRRLRRGASNNSPDRVLEPQLTPTVSDVARSLWQGNFAPPDPALGIDPESTVGAPPPQRKPTSPASGSTSESSNNPPDSNALVRSASPAHSGSRYARTVANLGIQAAGALDYAAQQGVLHRDVKPSNLLLDVRGTLWVTDFGLAKLADQEDLTHTGDLLGTLRYMAPERFRGKGDARSDVYGLGLTLYELLALRPAYEETDRSRLIDLMNRAEPTPLTKLDPSIPRDLATVIHKAVARDPSDRYQTAGELADDLQKFLDDRPIRARRLGFTGVAWRWARRNKTVASLLATVATMLVVLAVGSTIAADRYRAIAAKEKHASSLASAAQKQADTRRKEAEASAALADEAQKQAEIRRKEAETSAEVAKRAQSEAEQSDAESKAVVNFMINSVLASAQPSRSKGEPITVLQALERADKSIEGKLEKEPRVEAAIRSALSQTFRELGENKRSLVHAKRVFELREKLLGPENDGTLEAMNNLGWSYMTQLDRDQAKLGEALYRRVLEVLHGKNRDKDDIALAAMNGLAAILGNLDRPDEAIELFEKKLKIEQERHGVDHERTHSTMNNLALQLIKVGKLKEAESMMKIIAEHASKNHPDDLSTLLYMQNYIDLLTTLGRFEEAGDWALKSKDAHLRIYGFKHSRTQAALFRAVSTRRRDRADEEALALLEPMLEQARQEFGPEDERTVGILSAIVTRLRRIGDLARAAESAQEVFDTYVKIEGDDEDWRALGYLKELAMIRREQGEIVESRSRFRQFRDAATRALARTGERAVDPEEALNARRNVAFADQILKNLDRPGRSEVPPGEAGGPPLIVAPLQPNAPTLDGRIGEGEYLDAEGFAFDLTTPGNPGISSLLEATTPETKDATDLAIRVHAAHTDSALFLAFKVKDQYIRADTIASNASFLNDAVEVFIDGDRVPNDLNGIEFNGNHEGFQLIADTLGNQYSVAKGMDKARWKTAASRTDDGYIVEFEIPLALIDTKDGPEFVPAATGSDFYMNIGVPDIDDAISKQTFYGILWSDSRMWSPLMGGEDFWPAILRLAPPTASNAEVGR
jgi:serine/threonine protein kinase